MQTQIDKRVKLLKLHYQHAYSALLSLTGGGSWTNTLRELKDADVCMLRKNLLDVVELPGGGDAGEGAASVQDLGRPSCGSELISSKQQGKHSQLQSKGKRNPNLTVSWIWHAVPSAVDENDPALQEALRVEWAKAKVHAAQWHEEVEHVEEEM
ncbi:hypothetical protein EWM64_g4262 [Hericium alpestre]|uniref:Uncharacterized protein n=1 Tax=Hericium alpestre TaxID=135208 RepID=A0A4Z0A085_9AGAM|nr:hypothetical protein EWM64_g4262 [Hericium alpestre]